MEKFRHFGDAATGIHPFTFVISPTTQGRVGAICMFPLRLFFSSVFVLLLLFTDTLLWLFYAAYLGVFGKCLLAPLQRAWIRGLLFFIGHILPEQPITIAPPKTSMNASAKATVVSSRQLRAGDLVVCNLQSVWDGPVLEVMLAQPYHAFCFTDATVTDDGPAPGLRVFWPHPLQRWRVWCHVRRTGRLDFLTAQQSSNATKKSEELLLCHVQDAAVRAGVPVWWCGEGTCSNGKGLLPLPAVICRSLSSSSSSSSAVGNANFTSGTAAECPVYVATIQYDTPALHNVLGSDVEGFFGVLFRTSVLLYGSTAPAWSSPFFPTAEVTIRLVRLSRAAAHQVAGVEEKSGKSRSSASSADARSCWLLSAPALLELRNAMCQRGQTLVVSGSGGSGAAVRRQPLSVGIKEKRGFVEAYGAMLQKK